MRVPSLNRFRSLREGTRMSAQGTRFSRSLAVAVAVAALVLAGTGGSGKKLKAEFNSEPHRRGTVSMARAQSPDSGDSQFFICFADAPFLNGKYTVWGQVTEGMGNVDKIKRGEPVADPDRIISAKMAADAS